MPQRSNLFQRLVYKIYQNLAAEWQIVTESAMVPHRLTGQLREVDIKIEATLFSETIVIAVECRDRSRKADVTWVESMLKKHEYLTTSKLVLWSRTGFTADAITLAKGHNATCISPISEDDVDWGRIGRELKDGYVKHLIPGFHTFIDCKDDEEEAFRLETDHRDIQILNAQGGGVTSAHAFFSRIKYDQRVISALLDHATPGHNDFHMIYSPPEEWFADYGEGRKSKIFRLGVGVKATVEEGRLSTMSAVHDGKLTTVASADLNSGTFELITEEAIDGEPRVSGSHRFCQISGQLARKGVDG